MKRRFSLPARHGIRCAWWVLRRTIGGSGGSVLVTVLAIMAALSIILLTALTFALSRYAVHRRTLDRQGAAWLAQTGINRALASLTEVSETAPLPADSFVASNRGTVIYTTHSWGVLGLVAAEGRLGSQVVRRTAMIGSWQADALSAAVTVGDESLPLTVTGRTTITGDVVAGPAGVVEGRLGGIGALYPNFLHGALITRANIDLPAIDTGMLRRFLTDVERDRLQRDIVWPGSRKVGGEDGLPLEPGVIYVENNLIVDGATDWPPGQVRTIIVGGFVEIAGETRLSAPVRIIADTYIRVGGKAVLNGTLLYAEDSVIFADSCSFSGVALSPYFVAARHSAVFRFPAVLVSYSAAGDHDTSMVALGTVGAVEATLCATRLDTAASLRQAVVSVDTAATLYGCVMNDGATDLRGTVYGSVLTEQFLREVRPTTYINWLCDCRIDRSRLTYQPALPLLRDTAGRSNCRILWEGGDG